MSACTQLIRLTSSAMSKSTTTAPTIIEMIYALDRIAPGMANDDTLLYGVEVKFYSSRLKLSSELETQIPNLFAIGDGAGVTRGLSQAGASGVHTARAILTRIGGNEI